MVGWATTRGEGDLMGKQWFYTLGMKPVSGPCSTDQLKRLAASGHLRSRDRVWGGIWLHSARAGMIRWLALSLHRGVQKFPTTPPVLTTRRRSRP